MGASAGAGGSPTVQPPQPSQPTGRHWQKGVGWVNSTSSGQPAESRSTGNYPTVQPSRGYVADGPEDRHYVHTYERPTSGSTSAPTVTTPSTSSSVPAASTPASTPTTTTTTASTPPAAILQPARQPTATATPAASVQGKNRMAGQAIGKSARRPSYGGGGGGMAGQAR